MKPRYRLYVSVRTDFLQPRDPNELLVYEIAPWFDDVNDKRWAELEENQPLEILICDDPKTFGNHNFINIEVERRFTRGNLRGHLLPLGTISLPLREIPWETGGTLEYNLPVEEFQHQWKAKLIIEVRRY